MVFFITTKACYEGNARRRACDGCLRPPLRLTFLSIVDCALDNIINSVSEVCRRFVGIFFHHIDNAEAGDVNMQELVLFVRQMGASYCNV